MTDAIRANGQVVFDPTRVAHLSSRVAGTVAYVLKTVGDEVQAGDILALVDAAQVGQDKAQLLRAIVQLNLKRAAVERMRNLSADAAIAQKAVLEAESAFREAQIAFVAARQSLVNLGFDVPERVRGPGRRPNCRRPAACWDCRRRSSPRLPSGIKTANLIPMRATYEGVVVASRVVAGEVVETTTVLFTLADPRRMLLMLNVRQEDARYVAAGLTVMFQTDAGSAEVAGRVSWVSPAIDEKTRTLEVRVMLENGDGKLRDKAFGSGRIILRQEPNAIVVPREAVQSTSDASFVFVRDRNYLKDGAPKVFSARQVRIGTTADGYRGAFGRGSAGRSDRHQGKHRFVGPTAPQQFGCWLRLPRALGRVFVRYRMQTTLTQSYLRRTLKCSRGNATVGPRCASGW